MNNYRRFYMKKALFSYPWAGSGMRRRYLLGCLYAFLKSGFERKFYDLGKVGYWGPQSKKKVDFHFDMQPASMELRPRPATGRPNVGTSPWQDAGQDRTRGLGLLVGQPTRRWRTWMQSGADPQAPDSGPRRPRLETLSVRRRRTQRGDPTRRRSCRAR